jgi:hypothetical protein
MADHVKIGGTSTKGNNVSLSTRHCSCGSYFKVIVIKQADSCEAAREYFVSGGKCPKMEQQKQEFMLDFHVNFHLYGLGEGCNVSAM